MVAMFDNNATVIVALTSLQPFLAATLDFPTFSPRLFKASLLFHSLAIFE